MKIPLTKTTAAIGAGLLLSAASFTSQASIVAEIDRNDGNGYVSYPPETTLQDAIDNDQFFIYGSHYPEVKGDLSVWLGNRVVLTRTIGIFPIVVRCGVQLGGYPWVSGSTFYLAVTHGQIKPTPAGHPANDALCSNIDMYFNNNYTHAGFPAASSGAWVTSIGQTSLQTGPYVATPRVPGVVHNVQVDASVGFCSSTTGGSGGPIDASFSNESGNRSTFYFNDDIGGGGLTPCDIEGTVWALGPEEKAGINAVVDGNDVNTPGTPNPSPLSAGKLKVWQVPK